MTTISKFDSVIGICTGTSSKGTYVQLANGMTGFIPRTYLYKGVSVICSVTYVKHEEYFVFLSLDSVNYDIAA